MRLGTPRGGCLNRVASFSTTTSTQEVLAAAVDVPPGHVAVFTAGTLFVPSANTQGAGFIIDGNYAQVASINSNTPFTWSVEVGPGKHRVALGCNATSNAGGIQWTWMTWIIVRKDSKR
jgi:hypothetical protein